MASTPDSDGKGWGVVGIAGALVYFAAVSVPNRPGWPKCRTAVFGQDGGPYRVRHFSSGQGGGRRGTAGDCKSDVSWCEKNAVGGVCQLG